MSIAKLIKEVKRQDTIVSQPYREWLRKHGDDPLPAWVVDIISKQLTTQPRDRRYTFSPSSAGKCLRRQELEYLGIPPEFGNAPDARLMNIFNDGKWRHLRWQANLLSAGILDRIEVRLPWVRMKTTGSIDGAGHVRDDHPRVSWRGKEFGFELKGTNPYTYAITAGKDKQLEEHLKQVHRYILQGGFDLYVLLYEDKATNNWTEWVVEPDPKVLDEVNDELEQLNHAIDTRTLHPMLPSCKIRMGTTWAQCPYTKSNGVCESAGSWPL